MSKEFNEFVAECVRRRVTSLAVVGSRNFTDAARMAAYLDPLVAALGPMLILVSGGARGADTLAREYALSHQLRLLEYKPDWRGPAGRGAGPLRNQEIVDRSQAMLAFAAPDGKGSQDSIQKAQTKGIPCHVVWLRPDAQPQK